MVMKTMYDKLEVMHRIQVTDMENNILHSRYLYPENDQEECELWNKLLEESHYTIHRTVMHLRTTHAVYDTMGK